MAGLDRSRPYAAVIGDDQGRMFEQGGQYFRGDGSPWEPSGASAPAAAKAAPASKRAKVEEAPAPAGADDQLAAQLGGAA